MSEQRRKASGLTVKQAIELLSKIDDKTMRVLIDCPYCGKGNQISRIEECVVLSSPAEDEPMSEQRIDRLREALEALRQWEYWYSVDSSEFNRDNAREAGKRALRHNKIKIAEPLAEAAPPAKDCHDCGYENGQFAPCPKHESEYRTAPTGAALAAHEGGAAGVEFDSDQIARTIQSHLSLSKSDTALVQGYLHRAFVAGTKVQREGAAVAEPPAASKPQWNIEQVLVYIWQMIGEDQTEQEYPYSTFCDSNGGKLLRVQLEGLVAVAIAEAHAAGSRPASARTIYDEDHPPMASGQRETDWYEVAGQWRKRFEEVSEILHWLRTSDEARKAPAGEIADKLGAALASPAR